MFSPQVVNLGYPARRIRSPGLLPSGPVWENVPEARRTAAYSSAALVSAACSASAPATSAASPCAGSPSSSHRAHEICDPSSAVTTWGASASNARRSCSPARARSTLVSSITRSAKARSALVPGGGGGGGGGGAGRKWLRVPHSPRKGGSHRRGLGADVDSQRRRRWRRRRWGRRPLHRERQRVRRLPVRAAQEHGSADRLDRHARRNLRIAPGVGIAAQQPLRRRGGLGNRPDTSAFRGLEALARERDHRPRIPAGGAESRKN